MTRTPSFQDLLRYGVFVCLPTFFGTGMVIGQQFSIASPTINTCAGVLEDTGGPNGEYSNGENFTTVICPDIPGDAISLNWFVFTLSTQGPNPLDRIRIWDGNSTGATFLGEYTGNGLSGLISSATTYNTSGCLTVQFISNGGGTGNFAAGITCYTPCERPTAVGTMSEPGPAMVCVGEVVSFDGSASYAATGFNLTQYTWLFDDGSTANTPMTTHSYSEPGEYIVQLNLLDDNECVNSNVVDLQILVSTTPSFAGTFETTETCLGATVDLTGAATPTTWTGLPDANFGDGVYLPDDLGIPFVSDLVYTQFDPGQALTNPNDLQSICVSMEHSYMGDLVVQLACPNGQVMIMHQQGGGSTYLGDANDGDSNANPVIGECWDYCWSPTATLGTWAASSQWGATPNTTPSSQGTALTPGTYTSVQPFSNMVGCPLNGTWTITFTDLWGADNGFLCDWSLNFNPAIIPDATQFTPILGTATLDSVSWVGPNFVQDPTDPLVGSATANAPGSYNYVLNVTDNFGCTYDTTITIVVPPLPIVEAGPDILLCSDPLPLNGVIVSNPPSAGNITYIWSPAVGITDPSDPTTMVFNSTETMYYFSAYLTGHPECAVYDSVLVSPDPSNDPGDPRSILICASDPMIQMIDSLGGTPNSGGTWTNSGGATVSNTFAPAADPAGIYTYTLVSVNGCIASSTLEITILDEDDPLCCGVPIANAGGPMLSCNLAINLSATPGNTSVGVWSGPPGVVFSDPLDPQATAVMPPGSNGGYWFYWTENDGAFCNNMDSVLVTFTAPFVFDPIISDAVCYGYCDGKLNVAVSGGNAVDQLTYAWSTGASGAGLDSISGLCMGNYTLVVTDDNNCTDTANYSISEPILLEIDSMATQPVTCSGDCDGQVEIYDLEAVEYSFNDGASWSTDPVRIAACEAIYLTRIRDVAGCIGTGVIVVSGPPPVVSEFEWGPIPANINAPTIEFHNTSMDALTYVWDIAGLYSTTDTDTEFTFTNKVPDTYEVCLVAINFNDCRDTICHDVVIDDVLFTYIPNAFTPDDDGKNDMFGMSANIDVITKFDMMVFDRWGQIVYRTSDVTKPWTGRFENGGEILPQGVYAYRILFEIAGTNVQKELLGHVTLIK